MIVGRAIISFALMMGLSAICAAQQRPESFGVVVGAGQTPAVKAANYTAMKACVDAAMAENSSVLLPAGTIEIDMPNKGSLETSALRITGNLKITGAGQKATRLKFGPEAPTYRYAAFYIGPKTDVFFKGFTIEGPADPGSKGQFNAVTCGIRQVGSSPSPSGPVNDNPGRIRLKKVAIAGEFYTGISGDHGDVSLELTKCDVTAYVQCVAWFASFNSGKSLRASKTFFHDAGLGEELDDPVKGHLVYLSPPVSFDIDNCRFAGNFRYAIHHYGGSLLPTQFAILKNSTFESTCADGIETTNTGFTEITNCTFNTQRRAVALKGDTTIQDSTFNNGTKIHTYDIHTGVRVTITRCKFNGGGVNTSVWRDCVWNITDSDFVGNGPNSAGIASGAPGTKITIDNCRFSGAWKRGIRIEGGSYSISNCNFEGSYVEAAVVYDDTSGGVGELTVENCTFKNTGRSIWAQNGASGKVKGGDNFFATRMPEARSLQNANTATATPTEAGTEMYQGLQLRRGDSPEKLASGSLLAPSFNYDSYRVTGAARINSIKIGGSDEVTRMCAGRLELVAEGGWTLGEGGNIKPLSRGPRSVGEVIRLVHDPQAGFWVEVAN